MIKHVQTFANACAEGDLDYFEKYLQEPLLHGVDIEHAMHSAARCGSLSVVNRLLKDTRLRRSTALVDACEYGRLEIVKRLLKDYRIDPTADNNYSLLHAFFRRDKEMMDCLLQDHRVLFSYSRDNIIEKLIIQARSQWYMNRAQQFRELHTELVATVAVH